MERYRPFEADLRAGMPYHEALKKHINTTVYPWQYGDIGTPPHWVGKVVTIDEMFKTGGVCRHLAILSGMFLERALETGVPNESLGASTNCSMPRESGTGGCLFDIRPGDLPH